MGSRHKLLGLGNRIRIAGGGCQYLGVDRQKVACTNTRDTCPGVIREGQGLRRRAITIVVSLNLRQGRIRSGYMSLYLSDSIRTAGVGGQ